MDYPDNRSARNCWPGFVLCPRVRDCTLYLHNLLMKKSLKAIWALWKRFGERLATVVSRIILTALYFTIFLPAGIVYSFFKDELRARNPALTSTWIPQEASLETIEDLRKQS